MAEEPSRRAALLESSCAGDETLRREVESMLAHDEQTGRRLEVPALEMRRAAPPTLAAGYMLGRFRIEEKLGEGGMGVVYRAYDSQLRRRVALKVLPSDLASDPERRQRLLREARAASALDHPHICTLHDVGEDGGQTFLVMEYLTGETLAERLKKGPLSVDQALEIGAQVADALDVAHKHGIVHRDLKSANVMLTKTGAKLLDFGLAKMNRIGKGPALPTDATSTEQVPLSDSGAIVGTLPYMAPEQLEGRPVDARSDLWALGVMLYEMLIGERPFEGASHASLVAAILTRDVPPLATVQPLTPPLLDHLVRRCLEKTPDARWDSAHDIAEELRWVRENGDAISGAAATAHRTPKWKWAAIVSLALTASVIAYVAGVMPERVKAPAAGVVQTTVLLPAGMQLTRRDYGPIRTELALSPDGRYLVFSASPGEMESNAQLYRRALDRIEATPMPGTHGARMPFFSPDGKWVGFAAQSKLQKVELAGGIPVSLCDLSILLPTGASWGENGRIIIGTQSGGLQSVSAGGGKLEELTTVDPAKEGSHRLPFFLPGGRVVLFSVMPHQLGASGRIEALTLETGQRKVLVEDGTDGRYAPTGHLLFMRAGTLMAIPFDLDRLEVRGSAVPVVEGILHAVNEVSTYQNSGAGQYGFAPSGALVYAVGALRPDSQEQLAWIDRHGRVEPVKSAGKREFEFPRLSPDGQKIAFSSKYEIWVHDLVHGTSARLTHDGEAFAPIWTPDGHRVVFSYSLAGVPNLFWMPWDGSGPLERLSTSGRRQDAPSFSPDSRFIVFVETRPRGGHDILQMRLQTHQVSSIVSTNNDQMWPDLSPDGQWLAYSSIETGRDEVYVTPVAEPGRRIPISTEGGEEPAWGRSGRELFYWNLTEKSSEGFRLMAVDTVLRPDFQAGRPRVLFECERQWAIPARNYDISPDGRRFLIVMGSGGIKPLEVTRLHLVLNWFEELKTRVPSGKQ